MTRFARAQGSKSSNERSPHEATSWAEMKMQLIPNKVDIDDSKKQEFLELREKNYKDFLTETAAKQTNSWADFDEVSTSEYIPLSNGKAPLLNGKVDNMSLKPVKWKKKQQRTELQQTEEPENDIKIKKTKNVKVNNVEEESNTTSMKKKKSKTNQPVVEDSNATSIKKKKKSKTKIPGDVVQGKIVQPVIPKVEKVFTNEKDRLLYEKKVARRARQKEKTQQRKAILASGENNRLTQVLQEKGEKRKQKRLKKVLAKKDEREKLKSTVEPPVTSGENSLPNALSKTQKRKRRKDAKNVLTKETKTDIIVKDKLEPDVVNNEYTLDESTTSKSKKKSNSSSTDFEDSISDKQSESIEDTQILPKVQNGKKRIAEAIINESNLDNKSDVNVNKKAKKKKKKVDCINSVSSVESTDVANTNNLQNNQNNNIEHINNNLDASEASQQKSKPIKEHKLKNLKWTGDHRKKPMGPETTTLHLHGRSIEIALFDGFPVRKVDHERLTQLRKDMISKGVPRSEVQRAMQLERRRSEKALAREKKEVCFHCRKAGHKLTECSEALTHETEATGICFKCGSTEHTHFECKVVQHQQFKFATCFICREPGHIAKQCPQNARGIYPDGGCCKVCGDVTHLKKDCPQYQAQQEHNAIQVDTIDGANLEALDLEKDEVKMKAISTPVKKTKVVKF